MALTTEQRVAQNRENAQRSTGPKSPEGKARSRINALKHGLRADALPMPGEDPALLAARAQAWNDYYDPQSPGAQHLLNECVRATFRADRVDAYLAAHAEQRFAGHEEAKPERAEDVQPHLDGLMAGSPNALANLKATAAGRKWLTDCWERLVKNFHEVGVVHAEQVENYVLLLGPHTPKAQRFRELTGAFDTFQSRRHSAPPDRAAARVELDALVADELAALEVTETHVDTTPFAVRPALNLIPKDHATARLHLRYQSEARTAFQRAFKELTATLKRDSEENRQEEAPVEASPNEASVAATVSPNEAAVVVATARKPSVPHAPSAPTVRDERGLPTNMVNMCIVPGS